MALRPTTDLVAFGWLSLALPATGIGTRLPAADTAMRQNGFVRLSAAGGTPGRDTARRAPVFVAECWVPPASGIHLPPWNHSGALAEQVVAATFDPSLMGIAVDVTGMHLDGVALPEYLPARVDAVIALDEPHRVEGDPNNYARHEVSLLVQWVA